MKDAAVAVVAAALCYATAVTGQWIAAILFAAAAFAFGKAFLSHR